MMTTQDIREFTVAQDAPAMRLDKFLAAAMPEFSRSEIQRFDITRNGTAVKLSQNVRPGEIYRVIVSVPKTSVAADSVSNNLDLDILYQDDDIIVINKPRGAVMYPSAGNSTGTLVQNLLAVTHLSGLGGATRPGVVHRLDKDTSGVMVFAKSDAAYRELVKTFSNHDLTRKYVAFVWGLPNWEEATITGNIARSSRNRQKMTMVKTGGKHAHTDVAVMRAYRRSGVTAVRCTLLTGRTHQIRVHLSAHGFPVLCDPIYGRGTARLGTVKDPDLLEFLRTHDGQMLHAEFLEFTHPTTGAVMRFRAPLPGDMSELKYILESGE